MSSTPTNSEARSSGQTKDQVKVVIVGDGAVGKTCLCNTFINKKFPTDYTPTVFENHSQELTINGRDVVMNLMDTAGQEEYENIRVLGYPTTNCFIACFSVADTVTFNNLSAQWLPELRTHCPEAKILLAGTKADLRGQKRRGRSFKRSLRDKEVGQRSIRKLVKAEGLDGYIETSALRGGEDVDRVFHEAIRLGLGLDREDNEVIDGKELNSFMNGLTSQTSCIEKFCNIL